MVEQIVEKALCDSLAAMITGVYGVQVIGAWQRVGDGERKALEDGFARGYLSVKASPRSFDTYTSADGAIAVRLELNVRAERDTSGADYLDITRSIQNLLFRLHRSYEVGKDLFDNDDFIFTGVRLDGGDCGQDRDRCTWTWIQNLTIQGVFKN